MNVIGIVALALCIDAAQEEDSSKALAEIRRVYADGRDEETVLLVDRALLDAGSPQGELHFWRGAALRRLGRFQEAVVALDAAITSGYRVPEVHLERALTLAAQGNSSLADYEMDVARQLLQEDPERLGRFEHRWRDREPEAKRFEARVRPMVGYDTNLVGVGDDVTLQEDVDRDSLYYGFVLSARLALLEDRGKMFGVEYVGMARSYPDENSLSYVDNGLSLFGRAPLGEAVDIQARATVGEAFLAEEGHFRTLRSIGPGLLLRPAAGWELRLWASWGMVDYYTDAPEEQDRDGDYQQVGAGVRVDLGDGWALIPSLSYQVYDAEGSDYDYREWQPGVVLSIPAFWGIQASSSVGYVLADFDEPNSLSGFTQKRRDRRAVAGINVALVCLEGALGFAPSISLRMEDWDSNLDAYEFRRWQPQIDMAFLAYSF